MLLPWDIIKSLPDQAGAYILMDSWYTNPDILDECREKGCHLIEAMKTNRILGFVKCFVYVILYQFHIID